MQSPCFLLGMGFVPVRLGMAARALVRLVGLGLVRLETEGPRLRVRGKRLRCMLGGTACVSGGRLLDLWVWIVLLFLRILLLILVAVGMLEGRVVMVLRLG